jgi:hypothetical protein
MPEIMLALGFLKVSARYLKRATRAGDSAISARRGDRAATAYLSSPLRN